MDGLGAVIEGVIRWLSINTTFLISPDLPGFAGTDLPIFAGE